LHNDNPVEVVSCYRSPKTNMILASATDGVAKRSYHTRGMAIDIRMHGSSLPKIHKAAFAMRRGGVGYYPDSQFVHIDVGPVRRW
ncbi:MAG: YcbK family protein, partial [Bdellovibrionales bacterium]